MSVLRIYDPEESDPQGLPLDWERCRNCGGKGEVVYTNERANDMASRLIPMTGLRHVERCDRCGGHGSLKAAALHKLVVGQRARYPGASIWKPLPESFRVRCEDCGHPMSEGTWEGLNGLVLKRG